MGILVKLLWIKLWLRMLHRLLRRIGWAAVVPVTMLCLGISALMVAAATPGFSGGWAQADVLGARPVTIVMRLSGALTVQPIGKTVSKGGAPGKAAGQGKAAEWDYLILPGSLARPAVIAAPPAAMAGEGPSRLLQGPPPATMVHRHSAPAGHVPVLRPGPLKKNFVA